MQQYLEAGRIVNVHGVRGEMKMELWGDDVTAIKKSGRVFFSAQGGAERKVLQIRPQGNMALITLEGVNDMDTARTYAGRVLYLAREDIRLRRGEYFLQDLIGCRVVDAESGREYGKVTEVNHPGAQDLYTVQGENGAVHYLPGVPAFVKERRLKEGVILVTPIPGLFDEAENADAKEETAQ